MIEGYDARRTARGTKRTCGDCDERFYDLSRQPAVCPMCGVQQPEFAAIVIYDPTVPPPKPYRSREAARPKPVPKVETEIEAEDAAEVEEVEAAEEDEAATEGAAIVDEGFLEEVADDVDVPAVPRESETPDS